MASTAAEFALLLEPKISNIWHDSFTPEQSKYARCMNIRDMNKNTIHDLKMAGFGAFQPQPDGDVITYDDPVSPLTFSFFATSIASLIVLA